MRIACWISKATETHSEYVIILAFSTATMLHGCPSLLCYTYIFCLVICSLCNRPRRSRNGV